MAKWHELSGFEISGCQTDGHSISEIIETIDLWVLCVYSEYVMESITALHGQYCGNYKSLMTVTNGIKQELSAVTGKQHKLKSYPMQRVSDAYLAGQFSNL